MNTIISEELLSLVVGRKVTPIHVWDSNLEYSFMVNSIKHSQSINIYELAHKCKEWARKNKIIVSSCPYEFINEYVGNIDDFTFSSAFIDVKENENGCAYMQFTAETEPEAIFKACQWILDNKDNQ